MTARLLVICLKAYTDRAHANRFKARSMQPALHFALLFIIRSARRFAIPTLTISRIRWKFALLAIALFLSPFVSAQEADSALQISGIHSSSQELGVFSLSMEDIMSLPKTSFRTNTPWTESASKWEGVRVSDLLAYLKTDSKRFLAKALDDYEIILENVDFEKYPIIIAYMKDDQYLSVRELGPLWIMFPFDDYKELNTEVNRAFCVWQLSGIELL